MANPFDNDKVTKRDAADSTNDLFEWLRLSGHDYSILSSGEILNGKNFAFSHKDCKFYVAARREASAEQLAIISPFLRWSFDQIVPVMQEIEIEEEYTTKSGNTSTRKVKKEVPTGQFENKFPPTPENILKKKQEVLSTLYSQMSAPPAELVAAELRKIIPRLVDHESITAIVEAKGATDSARMKQKLARSLS